VKQKIKDLAALSKPGIVAMCLVMAAGGLWLAPGGVPASTWLWTMLGLTLSVSSANAWNMIIERDGDRYMNRTRNRPLPSGRMSVATAVVFALVTGVASCAILWTRVNPLTAAIALAALLGYVGIYTPSKRMTTWSLPIGAVPGAAPPLVGWAAATGEIGVPAIVLFLILFLWQLPHFLAISLYRQADYDSAGIVVVPSVYGEESTKHQALISSFLLVPVSLMLVPLHISGFFYFVVATAAGVWFFVLCLRGYEPAPTQRWARRFFLASIAYLPILTLAIAVDALLPR
jgi:protoheme IX farnesyltransferase